MLSSAGFWLSPSKEIFSPNALHDALRASPPQQRNLCNYSCGGQTRVDHCSSLPIANRNRKWTFLNSLSTICGWTTRMMLSSTQTVFCGPTDTAWLLSDGTCLVAGENKQGQFGLGHKDPVPLPVPMALPFHDTQVKSISMGPNSSAVIDTKGDLFTVPSALVDPPLRACVVGRARSRYTGIHLTGVCK
jgi:hypothetical protein